jgi:tRNA(adenine34) deaminase
MRLALAEAEKAAARNEIPVGAVLVGADGELLARDGNRSIELHDPTAHAEILVIRRAGEKIGNYRLTGSTLYVTIEPCLMCAGALIHARIGKLVFGAPDLKGGGIVSCYQVGRDNRLNHTIQVWDGIMATECATLLRVFFKGKRKN